MQSKAPIWVHQTIWEDCAVLLRDVQRGAEDRQAESVFAELSQVRPSFHAGSCCAGWGRIVCSWERQGKGSAARY